MPKDDFKTIQKEWYKKLKDEGFEDVEVGDYLKNSPIDNIINNSKYLDRTEDRDTYLRSKIETKQEYFRLAGQFLYSYKFRDEYDKTIWEMHAEGETVRDIGAKLGKSKTAIQSRISFLEKVMMLEAMRNEDV